jgi:hypothetical protein
MRLADLILLLLVSGGLLLLFGLLGWLADRIGGER